MDSLRRKHREVARVTILLVLVNVVNNLVFV